MLTLGMRIIDAEIAPGAARDAAAQQQAMLALVTLTIPLMLFSLPAGVLADRVSKRGVIVWMKALEVLLM